MYKYNKEDFFYGRNKHRVANDVTKTIKEEHKDPYNISEKLQKEKVDYVSDIVYTIDFFFFGIRNVLFILLFQIYIFCDIAKDSDLLIYERSAQNKIVRKSRRYQISAQ